MVIQLKSASWTGIPDGIRRANEAEVLMPTRAVIIAFAVHAFTATGAFVAFLALVAAAEKQFLLAWFWLGMCLLIDGVDGPLARHFNVKTVLPNWSGDMLDNIIDYVTFVLIPAFILYQSGFLENVYSFICAALIACTSAIYYADTRMKSRSNCFKGFPICWNMVVFTLFVIEPGWTIAIAVVLLSAVLTFVPILFIHPVRVKAWRPVNLGVLAVWCAAGLAALFFLSQSEVVPLWTKTLIALSALYLYCVGAVLQFTGRVD